MLQEGCQSVTEVRPSMALWQNRLPYQLVFVFLLTTVTVADLLDYIIPDTVHVLAHGKIQRSGGKELALELEKNGYAEFADAAA